MSTADRRIRAGDREREEVVDRLREAHVEGRLSLEELEQRCDLGYHATYLDELPALVADLPPPPTPEASGRRSSRHRPRLLRWVVVVAVVVSALLLVHGHPPFPLLWLGVGWLLWSRRASWARRSAAPRPRTVGGQW